MANVFGSGMATTSLSSIRAMPSTDEPSKPIPSSRAVSSSATEIAMLFRKPRMSVNHSLTNLTPSRSTVSSTCAFVIFAMGLPLR